MHLARIVLGGGARRSLAALGGEREGKTEGGWEWRKGGREGKYDYNPQICIPSVAHDQNASQRMSPNGRFSASFFIGRLYKFLTLGDAMSVRHGMVMFFPECLNSST